MRLETCIPGNSIDAVKNQKLENAIHTCESFVDKNTGSLNELILTPEIEMISTCSQTENSFNPVGASAFSEETVECTVEPLKCSVEASESITALESSDCSWVASEYIVEAMESVAEAAECIRETLQCNVHVLDCNSQVSCCNIAPLAFSVEPSRQKMEDLGCKIEFPGKCVEALQCKMEVLGNSVEALGDIMDASKSCAKASPSGVEFSGCNEVPGENGQKRKKGRPRKLERSSLEIPEPSLKRPRSTLISFEDHEIRRFIQSYKRFPRPFTRLEAVARDAGLQEKPRSELEELISLLYTGCHERFKEFDKNIPIGSKKREPTFEIGGVTVKVLEILQCEERLEPLFLSLTSDPTVRQKFQITVPCRPVYKWDVPWTLEDDSRLLQGIYEYGTCSWYPIKMDSRFKLTDKIHLDSDKKPQPSHLRKRACYLYTVLKEQLENREENQLNKRKIEDKPDIKKVVKKLKTREQNRLNEKKIEDRPKPDKKQVVIKLKTREQNQLDKKKIDHKPVKKRMMKMLSREVEVKNIIKVKTTDENSSKTPAKERGSFPLTRSRIHTPPTDVSQVTPRKLLGTSISSSTQTQERNMVLKDKDGYLQKILDQQDHILNSVTEVQNSVHNYMLAKLKIMAGYIPTKVLSEFESSFLTKK